MSLSRSVAPVAISFLSGCVDQISADLPAPPKVLVMNSILTPDSVFRVQMSRVTSTVDSASRLLSSANVYLLAPGQEAELLRNQGRGLYTSLNKPASGVPYTLRAEADGYPAVTATDTMPAAMPIRDAWHSYPTGTDIINELLGTIVVRFDDPADEVIYCELSAYQQQYAGQGRFYRSQDFVLDARGNAALAAEGDAEFNPGSSSSLTSSSTDKRLNCGLRFSLGDTARGRAWSMGFPLALGYRAMCTWYCAPSAAPITSTAKAGPATSTTMAPRGRAAI